jgi:hypothetical protein
VIKMSAENRNQAVEKAIAKVRDNHPQNCSTCGKKYNGCPIATSGYMEANYGCRYIIGLAADVVGQCGCASWKKEGAP